MRACQPHESGEALVQHRQHVSGLHVERSGGACRQLLGLRRLLQVPAQGSPPLLHVLLGANCRTYRGQLQQGGAARSPPRAGWRCGLKPPLCGWCTLEDVTGGSAATSVGGYDARQADSVWGAPGHATEASNCHTTVSTVLSSANNLTSLFTPGSLNHCPARRTLAVQPW